MSDRAVRERDGKAILPQLVLFPTSHPNYFFCENNDLQVSDTEFIFFYVFPTRRKASAEISKSGHCRGHNTYFRHV